VALVHGTQTTEKKTPQTHYTALQAPNVHASSRELASNVSLGQCVKNCGGF